MPSAMELELKEFLNACENEEHHGRPSPGGCRHDERPKIMLPPVTLIAAAGIILVASAGSAQAGLCGASIDTAWSVTPPDFGTQTVTPSMVSTGFVGCESVAQFSGLVETDWPGDPPESDFFNFYLEALDDSHLRLRGQSINDVPAIGGIHHFPEVTVTLTNFVTPEGPLEILSAIAVPFELYGEIDLLSDAALSIHWNLSAVGDHPLFPEEITVDTEFAVTTARPAIPEPMSLALFGAGLAGFSLLRQRRSTERRHSKDTP